MTCVYSKCLPSSLFHLPRPTCPRTPLSLHADREKYRKHSYLKIPFGIRFLNVSSRRCLLSLCRELSPQNIFTPFVLEFVYGSVSHSCCNTQSFEVFLTPGPLLNVVPLGQSLHCALTGCSSIHNSCSQETETGETEVQCHLWLYSKFQANLSYTKPT